MRAHNGHVHIIHNYFGGTAFIHHEHGAGAPHDYQHDRATRHNVNLGPAYNVDVVFHYFNGDGEVVT